MTAIDKLDSIYAESIEKDLGQVTKSELTSIFTKIIETCDDFLTSPTLVLSADRKNQFRKLRALSADELTAIELGHDPLCHYVLLRELLESSFAFVRRGCKDFVTV